MTFLKKFWTKINDAIRPPHVGPLPPTDITALGGTMNSKDAAEYGGAASAKGAAQIGQMSQ